MHYLNTLVFSSSSILSTLTLLLLLPTLIDAGDYPTTSAPPSPTITGCVTVTSTNGGSCPPHTPTPCAVIDCLFLSTVTLNCGCPSIYTERLCTSTCESGCGTQYQTHYLPCATSPSFSSSSFSGYSTWSSSTPVFENTSTISVTSGSATTKPTPTKSSKSRSHSHSHSEESKSTITCTETNPGNTTTVIITSTSITTITSCPAKVACHGQTTTWQGSGGPYPCMSTKTCSCVLPGGGNTTTTGTGTGTAGGVVTTAGGVVTTSTGKAASSTKVTPTQVQANGARGMFGSGVKGWVVGALGLLVGGL